MVPSVVLVNKEMFCPSKLLLRSCLSVKKDKIYYSGRMRINFRVKKVGFWMYLPKSRHACIIMLIIEILH